MAFRIPGGLVYTGADLGFDAQVVANGTTVTGPIVPWRIAYAFETLVLHVQIIAGAMNFTPRMNIVDFDQTTIIQSVLTSGAVVSGNTGWSLWMKDNVPRGTAGTIGQTGLGLLGAPFASMAITNNDAAPATFTVEALLLRGTE